MIFFAITVIFSTCLFMLALVRWFQDRGCKLCYNAYYIVICYRLCDVFRYNSPNSLLYRVFDGTLYIGTSDASAISLGFCSYLGDYSYVAILFVSIILFSYLAIRIYRLGSLSYGNRMKILPTMN